MESPQYPRPRRPWFAYVPVLVFTLIALAFLLQIWLGSDDLPSTLLDRPAPEFSMEPLEGLVGADGPIPAFSTESLNGQVTLVNVFGSWCVPCRDEHPFLMQLAEDERFAIYGINQRDATADALRFLGDFGNPYDAVGVDPRQRVSIEWGVYGVPETFIVDHEGIVRHKVIGPMDQAILDEEVMPIVEELLAAAG